VNFLRAKVEGGLTTATMEHVCQMHRDMIAKVLPLLDHADLTIIIIIIILHDCFVEEKEEEEEFGFCTFSTLRSIC